MTHERLHHSRQSSTQAPSKILMVTVDGPTSFATNATKKLVREQLFKEDVQLAATLNALFL
jgi:hypothetical protein